jgi:hypothetical protein
VLDQLAAGNLVPKDLDGGQWQALRNNPDRNRYLVQAVLD